MLVKNASEMRRKCVRSYITLRYYTEMSAGVEENCEDLSQDGHWSRPKFVLNTFQIKVQNRYSFKPTCLDGSWYVSR
jgi:hypothetical protein